ncbi:MAG: poly-beta,6 N-acetyl-D-glucosamine synthase, partial [Pseudomonadota bacterium]
YWITGALLFRLLRERHEPLPDAPPQLPEYPGVSLLVPCHNESATADETFAALAAVQYPGLEIIAINDGSKDDTAAVLERLTAQIPNLRVVHLERNQGKSVALNVGALVARNEILVCIDGDALLDPHAVTWFVRRFQSDPGLGALTGNPRIRNRGSLLGRMQVGEFSSIVGLIKRAQTVYGRIFTVSGVICAFRKRALHDAGWWSPTALTDDVDVTWRVQLAGWRATFEPKALCWILMPETIKGLWRQRLRWAEGGSQSLLAATAPMFNQRAWRMLPVWLNHWISVIWAYAITLCMAWWIIWSLSGGRLPESVALSPLPSSWGMILVLTYFAQALISALLDERFERGIWRQIFWIIWYPLAFWILQVCTAIIALPRALLRPKDAPGTWVSPDRGFRG